MRTRRGRRGVGLREDVKVLARSGRRIRAIIPMAFFPLLGSCYESLDICGESFSLPDERVLEVLRISNASNAVPIPMATLSDFSYNGIEFFADGAARTGGGPGAEVISRSEIRCTTPCKFGGQQGSYGFLVTAPGFQAKRVEFAADWLNKSDDCLVMLSGATPVEITLEPQG